MQITGLVVCVDFAPELAMSIDRWMLGAQIIVVTSPDDKATIELCRSKGIVYYPTDAFYRNGAMFNKGAAIAETVEMLELLDRRDWLLFFDADVMPSERWRYFLAKGQPVPGNIYGAYRQREDGKMLFDRDIAGYFMLFHSTDPNAQTKPIVETCWGNAGNWDTHFQEKWNKPGDDRRDKLDLTLTHFGETSQNWCGRGRLDLMKRLFDERRRRGGYQHERIGQ